MHIEPFEEGPRGHRPESVVLGAGGETKKDVYRTERWSNNGLGYSFEVEPGRYERVLLFSETNTTFAGKGRRRFDIELKAKTVAK